jgi:hypothetical protein
MSLAMLAMLAMDICQRGPDRHFTSKVTPVAYGGQGELPDRRWVRDVIVFATLLLIRA